MSKKFPLRFKKTPSEEPEKYKDNQKIFRVELLKGVADRYCHFPKSDDYEDPYSEDEENSKLTGKLSNRQSISLKNINAIVKKHNLDESNVYLTASFSDDYLSVEVVNIKLLSKEEKEEEYIKECSEWKKYKAEIKQQEEDRLKFEIENLQMRINNLKKDSKV